MMTSDDFTTAARALRFELEAHRYTVGAIQLASVTQILRAVGVSRDWSDIPPAVLEAKRSLGQAVHAATHYYDEGTLKPGTVDPRVEPYLQAWITFRADTGFTPALLETPLYHPGLLIAGAIDRAGFFGKFAEADPRDLYPVDLKCGDPEDAAADWQTAAYAQLLSLSISRSSPFAPAAAKLSVRRRYSVQLQPTGRYKLHPYDDTVRKWMEFTHFTTTFRSQHVRRAA